MQKLAALLLMGLVGCSGSSQPVIPPTSSDFVKNDGGVGTARVFGIDFQVHVESSGAGTDDAIAVNFVDPEKTGARKRFHFGDEVTIQLDSVDGSEVTFVLNDQDFGTLKVGDKVVIDAERKVQVNGTARLPKVSQP
jgi:hypothetical protein